MNNYKKQSLSNRIPLITVPVKGAKTSTLLVMFRTGSKYEARQESGLSHFLEHMFFKGTKKRSTTLKLSGELDSLGGEYNAFTSKEYTAYYVKVANSKLGRASEILSDMLQNSLFDAQEIEREKGVIIEELNMYEDNPQMHIEDVLEECLYGDTPAGWSTIGTKANIRAFTRDDFIEYYRRQYGSRSAFIILAGAVKRSDTAHLKQLFSQIGSNPYKNKLPVKENQKAPQIRVARKKTDQVTLGLAVRTYPFGHPDEFKLKMLAVILGGSMSSRLFISLRERKGLAYYVRSFSEMMSDSGYLVTYAGVPKPKLKEAISIILSEYKRLKTELVDDKELKRAKDIIQGNVLLQMEASDNLANWYARQSLYRKEPVTPGEMIKRVQKISASDLREVARRIFVSRGLNLALIGQVDASSLRPGLKL